MIFNPPVITVDEAKSIDSAAMSALGISSLVLMENAARGICELIKQKFSDVPSILIACGFGNNGGDGLALARLLAAENIEASTYLIDAGRTLSADAAANHRLLASCKLPLCCDSNGITFRKDIQRLDSKCLIVDCLLGTGIQGNPKAPYSEVIQAVNQSAAQVLAVDVPSGLNAQTGVAGSPTVVANHTMTFVGKKLGFETRQGQQHTGDVSVAPIGLPVCWVKSFLKQHREKANSDEC